ncbi:MAG: amidohydrolase [Pseudomonadales bacterium]
MRFLAVLFLSAFLAACSNDEPVSVPVPAPAKLIADQLFFNGPIITINDAQPQVEALATKDGKIIATGDLEALQLLTNTTTQQVDLAGKTLLPGFIDAHGHLALAAMNLAFANVASPPVGPVNNIDDLLSELTKSAASIAPGEWILGRSYDDSLLAEQRHPTKADLDKVSTENPVYIWHVSAHLGVCNTKCLQMIGVDENTANPPGGVFQRIEGSNEPNGVMEEHAMYAALMAIPAVTDPSKQMPLLLQAQEWFIQHGITTVQDGATSAIGFPLMQAAANNDLFKIDVVAFPVWRDAEQVMNSGWPIGSYQNRLKLGGVKLVLDGSPQGKTAWLSHPYHIPPAGKAADYAGYPSMQDEELEQELNKFYRKGWPVLAHTNGDAAIDQLLNAVDKARKDQGKADRRTVLIHAQTMREDQIDRTAEFDMIPSYFVSHTFYWGDWHRDSVLGPERGANISPLRSTQLRNIPFTIHNDTPVVPPNMTRLLWTAVNRITRSGKVLGPEQRVDVMTALKAITINAAYQYFEEDSKGSLEVGKRADLVILSENPLTYPAEKLDKIEVVATYKDGVSVYEKSVAVSHRPAEEAE